jgi:hypothetical protein
MGVDFAYGDGQSPLDEEEKEGLLIPTITTREELDEFEQLNIQKAVEWTLREIQERKNPDRRIRKRPSQKDVGRRVEVGGNVQKLE